MAISYLQLDHIHDDAAFEVFLLIQELDRIVDVAKNHFDLALGALHPEHNEYVCEECLLAEDETILFEGVGALMSVSPVYCSICDVKLAHDNLAINGTRTVNFLKTIVRTGVPLQKEQWYDLRQAVENFYISDPSWHDVEYIVYKGSAIDPELSAG